MTRWLGVEPERIVVTPLAVDDVFAPVARRQRWAGANRGAIPGAGLPAALRGKRYVLNVGAHDERKNTATLSAAYERAFPNGEVALAFTRRPPRLPRGGVVVELPDDAALAALYRGAALVVLPSPYEGFGLPLLEAMACGAPVLAARAGALPEVGGDAAAWVDDAARRWRLGRRAAQAAGRRRGAGPAGGGRAGAGRRLLVGALHRADAGGAARHGRRLVRALLVVRPDAFAKPGGDVVHAQRCEAALRALGAEVTLLASAAPRPARLRRRARVRRVRAGDGAAQIAALRAHGAPLVLSPIWLDLRALLRDRAARSSARWPRAARRRSSARLARLHAVEPRLPWRGGVARDADRRLAAQRELVLAADVVLPASEVEAYLYGERLRASRVPFVVAPLGVDDEAFGVERPRLRARACCARRGSSPRRTRPRCSTPCATSTST